MAQNSENGKTLFDVLGDTGLSSNVRLIALIILISIELEVGAGPITRLPFPDPEWLAERAGISVPEAKASVAVLQTWGAS